MNADKFFEKYSIEEISKKTKISPISLRFIRNKEFDKIPRAKFFGFVNIIEKEFNVDLSDLKEEYNNFHPQKPQKSHQEVKIEPSKNRNFSIIILAFILLIIGGYFLYNANKTTSPQQTQADLNISTMTNNNSTNSTQIQNIAQPIIHTNENNTTTNPVKTVKEVNKTTKKYQVIIIPQKKVWFRAINIDTNKTIEFLTSKEKVLPKGNYYIKFGHGEITINYNNQTITPNTKKIIRILFKNGTYKFMKKPNRYEK